MSNRRKIKKSSYVGAVEYAADLILADGSDTEIVVLPEHEICVVADHVITEGIANGMDVAETQSLQRADGRTVYIYKMPPDMIAVYRTRPP